MQLKLILASAFLCAYFSSVAASYLGPARLFRSGTPEETVEPIVLEADFLKERVVLKSCYGAHFKASEGNTSYYWILPAECLDKTKYDRVKVKFIQQGALVEFPLEDLDYEIHPNYDAATKVHNIALARIPSFVYRKTMKEFKYLELPSATDHLDDKTLELYENKDKISRNTTHIRGNVSYSVKAKVISSIWCRILHPLTPMETNHVCLSGFGEGLQKVDLGAPLIAHDGESFKLVGLATKITSGLNFPFLPKEAEILKIQSYLDWIKPDTRSGPLSDKIDRSPVVYMSFYDP